MDRQQQSLLPVHYFHLVFTLPDSLRLPVLFNQQPLFDLFYQAASRTLLKLAAQKSGVIPGFSLILHTWSQTLAFHPHLHCILAGGGLSSDGQHFQLFKKKFFIHVKVLSAVFKGIFLEGFKQLFASGLLKFPFDDGRLLHPDAFSSFLDGLYAIDWVVFSKPVFKCADHVLKYLGRYTHRVAISDHRITAFSDDTVSFSYLDNKDGGKKKVLTLSSHEFIRRFLLHVLPHRFVKFRHYGFLSNRFRAEKVALCRRLIARQRGVMITLPKSHDKFQLLRKH